MRRMIWIGVAAMLLPAAAHADTGAPAKIAAVRRTVAAISAVQELPPFSAEEMTKRHAELGDDDEAVAADTALNGWKLCILDSVARWAPLKEGPSTVADGAFGRCADTEIAYRNHLVKLTQDGRSPIDPQMARGLVKTLEDIWRPRIVAAVLEQKLAAMAPAVAPPK